MTTAEATGRTHLVFYPGAADSKPLIAQAQLLQSAAVLAREDADPRVQLFDQLAKRALPLLSDSIWRARPGDDPSRAGALVWGQGDGSIELDYDDADPELAAQGHRLLAEIDQILINNQLRALADPSASTLEFSSPAGLRALVVECVLPSLALGTPVESHPLLKEYLEPKLMAPPKWRVTLPGWQPAEEQSSFEKRVRKAFRKAVKIYLEREITRRQRFLSRGYDRDNRTRHRKGKIPLRYFGYFVRFQIMGLSAPEVVEAAGKQADRAAVAHAKYPSSGEVLSACRLVAEATGIQLRQD